MSEVPSSSCSPLRRIVLLVVVVLGVGALFVVRGMTFMMLARWAAQVPAGVQLVVSAVAGAGLLLMVALFAVAAVQARSDGLLRLAVALTAGLGVVLAYGASELTKLLVTELRPCHNFEITTIATCPAVGDWAWPSNHATLAGALATSVVLLAPRLGTPAVGAAVAVAAARVLVGVHYLHDVAAGLVLGALVVLVVVQLGRGPGHRLLVAAAGRSTLVRVLTGGHHQPPQPWLSRRRPPTPAPR